MATPEWLQLTASIAHRMLFAFVYSVLGPSCQRGRATGGAAQDQEAPLVSQAGTTLLT